MIFYHNRNGIFESLSWLPGEPIPDDFVWADLLVPTKEEEVALETFLGIEIPTREEMREIELSNRLYQENGAQFMTVNMLAKVDTAMPMTHAATFVLVGSRMVTIRYVDTTSFRRFTTQVVKSPGSTDGVGLFLLAFDAIVNRLADVLERLDREIDVVTKDIFRHADAEKNTMRMNYQSVLERIGRCGDLASKIHESLVTLGRAAGFAVHHKQLLAEPLDAELTSIRKDITGLTEHGNYLTGKVQFLLDATLGMISIQQNGVFRVLSIASLIFMPPTLIAGIYGMNFRLMPELGWHYGYPMAMVLILLSAVLPLALMRQRKII